MKWHRFARGALQGNDGLFDALVAGRRGRWGWRLWHPGGLVVIDEDRTLREAVKAVQATVTQRAELEAQYAEYVEVSRLIAGA